MRIGYLGVGKMGQPMAGKLLDAGHELLVHDIREDAMRPLLERQARQAASPKELADMLRHGHRLAADARDFSACAFRT